MGGAPLLALLALLAGGSLVAAAPAPAPAPAPLYRDGPPPGFAGGFGQQSCHACHFEKDLDAPGGSVALEGVPAEYAAGQTYTLTVRLTRPGLALGGFQLSSRFEEGGAQAGRLAPAPGAAERISVSAAQEIQYAYQRHAGSTPVAPDTARWTLEWTAPESGGGAVVFHVAANAADGDDSVSGDYVHTASVRSAAKGR